MNALVEDIKKAAQRRKYGVIDRYVEKLGGDEAVANIMERNHEDCVEFYKDIMVEVGGIWYRCRCTLSYSVHEYSDEGDRWTPPCEWTESDYDCYVRSIRNERTRRTIYGKN